MQSDGDEKQERRRMTMTTTHAPTEPSDIRELHAAEIEDVSGGAVSLGTYIRRLIWQAMKAPENSTLIGCSDDMSVCSWQSN
jgi:hypothetical protein